jgi:ubiquitin carboxyl-terminal hydrolase L3
MAAVTTASFTSDAVAVPPASQFSGESNKRWFPLESNPDVMNSYSKKLGFPTDKYQWVDILSTEEWVSWRVRDFVRVVVVSTCLPCRRLAWCHSLCKPLFCYFPSKIRLKLLAVSRPSESKLQGRRLRRTCTVCLPSPVQCLAFLTDPPARSIDTKQTVGNACGTVGILHSVANVCSLTGGPVELPEDSWFSQFIVRTLPQNAEARAQALEDDKETEVKQELQNSACCNRLRRTSIKRQHRQR